MSVQLETQGDTARPRLAPVPTPRPRSDRSRPRWREDVGAAVLLSVLATLRDEDVTTSA